MRALIEELAPELALKLPSKDRESSAPVANALAAIAAAHAAQQDVTTTGTHRHGSAAKFGTANNALLSLRCRCRGPRKRDRNKKANRQKFETDHD
jgi:hypothetical protein